MDMQTIKMTTNPYDNNPVYEYRDHDERDVDRIIMRASSVAPYWAQVSMKERRFFLEELHHTVEKKKKTLAETITKEMGKPLSQSIAEVEKCMSLLDYYRDLDPKQIDEVLSVGRTVPAKIELAPLGVVLAIMPWNFPMWQVFRCAVPAILGGNALVLKHASNVTYSATLIAECFAECGLPEDLFGHLVYPSHKMSALIERPEISAVSFTGSSAVGIEIAKCAAKGIKKVVLELGGMDPYIVLEDADLEVAAKEIAKSRLGNSGQSCIAAKRCFVQKSVEAEFLTLLAIEFSSYECSNPLCKETDIGPIAKEEIARKINSYLQNDLSEGATLYYESDLENVRYRENYIAPTILTNVTREMNVMKKEIFAPILPVVGFESLHQAITMANSTPYGLGGGVFGGHDKNIAEVASKLQCGNVGINATVASHPAVPFGGIKQSGIGRELGILGLLEFQNIKSLYYKR